MIQDTVSFRRQPICQAQPEGLMSLSSGDHLAWSTPHLSSLSHGFCMFSGGLEGWHAGHSHGGIEQDVEGNRLYLSNGETEAED